MTMISIGDGVNIAVRLEGIAEPGGICVSGRCSPRMREARLISPSRSREPQTLKNIAEPMRVYRVYRPKLFDGNKNATGTTAGAARQTIDRRAAVH